MCTCVDPLQLGSKFGTWLLERGLKPQYGYMGTIKEGCGGLSEQIPYQGLDPGCKTEPTSRVLFLRINTPYRSDHQEDRAVVAGSPLMMMMRD